MRISPEQAGQILGMSAQSVRIGIQRGKIPGTCWKGNGTRMIYYTTTELIRRFKEEGKYEERQPGNS